MGSNFKKKDIISITDFTREEIIYLCKKAKQMYDLEKNNKRHKLNKALKTRALSSMFYEPSTRTKMSFNTAMRELGGQCDGFAGTEGTSVMKKETIRDTIVMMEANHFDVIVMRHPLDGSLQWAADVAQIPVINGGDGKNEHPTQSLLDIFSLYLLNNEKLDNITLGFGGDLSHGRTIKSLSLALSHFKNITIIWAAEDFLGMPEELTKLLKLRGVNVLRKKTVEQVIKEVDFYYMTRPQLERMKEMPKGKVLEMVKKYRIDLKKVKNFKGKIMHPLPIDSEIAEIDYKVCFDKSQGFFQQAENGIFLRKALLHEMLKHNNYITFNGKPSSELEFGNNKIKRAIHNKKRKGKFIDMISDGTAFGYLTLGTSHKIENILNLENRGYDTIPGNLPKEKKSFLKSTLMELSEREMKQVALISPEPTINYIKDEKVISKFVYILCRNNNCITKVVNEDVPSKFYNDKGTIRCRYCRTPYTIKTDNLSEKEKKEFIRSLPTKIEPIR